VLLSRICSRYYFEDRTQAEIAAEFGLSRPKVQRMIREARRQGIVEIQVHPAPAVRVELECQLKAVFGLESALVIDSHPDETSCRRLVARSVAEYLESRLDGGSVVAVGLGRNTSAVAAAFAPRRPLACTFVSAMGGSPALGVGINPNEVCSTFAARSGSSQDTLYAPAFVEELALREPLLRLPAVAATLDVARRAASAITGIGAVADTSILVQANCIDDREVRDLRHRGAVGEILGNFFDIHGQPVQSHLDSQLIGLTLADLQRIPLVVAVVSESNKLKAIAGALRTGTVNVLATTSHNALGLLRLAGTAGLRVKGAAGGEGYDRFGREVRPCAATPAHPGTIDRQKGAVNLYG
jgi:DNA-binding transcriptional regulator LsrR (DeoR family)